MFSGEIGRCSEGGRVSAMCQSIFCRSVTGKTCGDSVPEVAASMYSIVCVETIQRQWRESQRLANTDLRCNIIWLKLILVASEVVRL